MAAVRYFDRQPMNPLTKGKQTDSWSNWVPWLADWYYPSPVWSGSFSGDHTEHSLITDPPVKSEIAIGMDTFTPIRDD
jgi:hypothetical protein